MRPDPGYAARVTIGEHIAHEMYVAGVRAWPEVRVEWSTFREHIARAPRGKPNPDLMRYAADLYLCCACAAKDDAARAIVVRDGARSVRRAIARVGRDPAFVRDTLEGFWSQLLSGPDPQIERYSGRGSLRAWLRVIASRVALERCRAQRRSAEREASPAQHFVGARLGPMVPIRRGAYESAFQDALERAIDDLPSADRNLLRLHVRRCGVDEIGRIYNVQAATAARWLERATGRVLVAAQQRLAPTSAMPSRASCLN